MALRRNKPEESGEERWMEVDASMTGSLSFKDPVNLQINGRFDGTLDAKGNLSIGEKAQVKATIKGESVTIGGSVNGTINATSRVELLATARVTGKVSSPRVIMHDGAVLHGTLEMGGGGGEQPWMSTDELARYLEVEAETVSQWAQSGRLPAQREGGEWRFNRAKIEEWLAHERVK
jgi:excisionase family DNA binding protein